MSTGLAQLKKKYHARDAPSSRDMDETGHLFLGQRIPVPVFNSPTLPHPREGDTLPVVSRVTAQNSFTDTEEKYL